jgi:DNA-binding CsgD family transcriptional regulator
MKGPDPIWQEVWTLLQEEGPALAKIARAQSKVDHEDLVHAFFLEKVPKVVELVADLSPANRSAYVRSAFRNFVRSAARDEKRHSSALERLANEFVVTLGAPGHVGAAIDPTQLRSALSLLPTSCAQASRLFLGLDGPPRSLRQIASALGTSRHTARIAVLDGLLAAAIALEHTGVLSPREVESCRLVLLEGSSVEASAMQLNVSPHQVRSAIESARAVIASAI